MAWRTRHGGAAMLAVLVALIAWAQPAYAETTLEATTPTGEYYQNAGGRLPVLVTITSDGATEGDVVIVFENRFPRVGTAARLGYRQNFRHASVAAAARPSWYAAPCRCRG